MSGTSDNERLKHRANFLSNLAVATAATGILGPIVGMAFSANPDAVEKPLVALIMVCYLLVAIVIYYNSAIILDALVDEKR